MILYQIFLSNSLYNSCHDFLLNILQNNASEKISILNILDIKFKFLMS